MEAGNTGRPSPGSSEEEEENKISVVGSSGLSLRIGQDEMIERPESRGACSLYDGPVRIKAESRLDAS